MRNCQSIDPLVTPYVDRELPDSDRQAVDEHLRACPPCHSRVAAEEAVRNLVHARQPALHARVAPPALRAKCAALAEALKVDGARESAGPASAGEAPKSTVVEA